MFITLEGIDGAGCGEVRRALEKKLTERKVKFEALKYPVPSLPFGRDIYEMLGEKLEMEPDIIFLAFAGQMAIEKKRLKLLRRKLLIVDRYLPCTLAYQGAHGFPFKKGLEFARLFQLEKPDVMFYLDLPWEVAYERKNKEKRKSDRFEKDKQLYRKTSKLYLEMINKRILGKWVKIDATKTPEEEAEEIIKHLFASKRMQKIKL